MLGQELQLSRLLSSIVARSALYLCMTHSVGFGKLVFGLDTFGVIQHNWQVICVWDCFLNMFEITVMSSHELYQNIHSGWSGGRSGWIYGMAYSLMCTTTYVRSLFEGMGMRSSTEKQLCKEMITRKHFNLGYCQELQ